jgi:hypothetical protein
LPFNAANLRSSLATRSSIYYYYDEADYQRS